MWKILLPLLILLVVSLIGVKTYENYVSYSGNLYDASGNIIGNIGKNSVDPSGNIIDSSGNVLGNINQTGSSSSGVSQSGLITLSLTDLLTLFSKSTSSNKSSTSSTSTDSKSSSSTSSIQSVSTGNTAVDMYNQIKPSLISDITTAVRSGINGSPYTPAAPLPMEGSCSDSTAQGTELQNAQSSLIDSNEYIRKDSIPCYGCTLPQ